MTHPLPRDTISKSFPGRPRPGDVLSRKYRIERELGSGGMGVVYEVSHLAMPGARFAIKWLPPFDDEDGLRRFQREARISGAIRHRHVIEVYDVHIGERGSYLVMELLEGETLAARIERELGLHATHACTIISQCLSGVGAAHAAGVVHRDIKPANIFLWSNIADATVHPKVLDFGVSRVVSGFPSMESSLTHGAIIGTPAYMAPEQLQARGCDVRTDIYAMGVTLYEALAGKRAFSAASHADLVVQIVTGNVTPLHQVVAGLPAGLSAIVMRAMHKDPERRYDNVASFTAALEPYLQPAVEDRAGSQKKSRAEAARVGFRSVALGAGAGALVVGALLATSSGRPTETHKSPATTATAEPKAASEQEQGPTPIVADHEPTDGERVQVDGPARSLPAQTRESRDAAAQQSAPSEVAETSKRRKKPERRVVQAEPPSFRTLAPPSPPSAAVPPPAPATAASTEQSEDDSPELPRPRPPLTLESL